MTEVYKEKIRVENENLDFDHLTNIANSLTKYLGIISKTEFFLQRKRCISNINS